MNGTYPRTFRLRGAGSGYRLAVTPRTDPDVDPEDPDDAQRDDRDLRGEALEHRYPGAHAHLPHEIPPKGWWQVVRRGLKEFSTDQMSLIAAGVAFYAFLSLVPALIAAVLLYGLVTDPVEVERQINALSGALPESAQSLLQDQMRQLVTANRQGLGIGLVVSVLASLWSASSGVGNLISAVNTAYDEQEKRGFVKRKALALVLTLGAIIVFVLATGLVAVFPAVANAVNLSGAVGILLNAGRWVFVLLVVMVALAIVYRLAPARENPRMRWVSVGSVVATVVWVAVSIGFSVYVNNFSSYGKTYGSLAGVVVLLIWLWLSLCAVLLGAELNAESEKQTVRDTTTGPEEPMGERGALKADLGPADPEPDPAEASDDAGSATPPPQGSGRHSPPATSSAGAGTRRGCRHAR